MKKDPLSLSGYGLIYHKLLPSTRLLAATSLLSAVVASLCAGPATPAGNRLERPEDLVGTWTGRMMNVTPGQASNRGIETTFTFSQDPSGALKGSASFSNLDLRTNATGLIESVSLDGQTVTFPLTYRGGAPGVNGTVGRYKLKFIDPDTLEGDSENRQTGSYLKLTIKRQPK